MQRSNDMISCGNPRFADGSLVGWNSNDLGDSFFSSSIGGDSDIASVGGDSDISSGHAALAKITRAQLVHYGNQGARN
jgi:hypothetical protein